ncbi:hypothetical protein SAMN05421504_101915 [Amycolatopsis xylanica]|uniref:Uncharacterized protein n=1 Tax=Amycolatopsis xylanica TaxID=589385 RepID=A0A1H2UKD8_9PSEU|nr:hypothetical protein SAMN05421504_101915 [Amycolatopsis xylanica]
MYLGPPTGLFYSASDLIAVGFGDATPRAGSQPTATPPGLVPAPPRPIRSSLAHPGLAGAASPARPGRLRPIAHTPTPGRRPASHRPRPSSGLASRPLRFAFRLLRHARRPLRRTADSPGTRADSPGTLAPASQARTTARGLRPDRQASVSSAYVPRRLSKRAPTGQVCVRIGQALLPTPRARVPTARVRTPAGWARTHSSRRMAPLRTRRLRDGFRSANPRPCGIGARNSSGSGVALVDLGWNARLECRPGEVPPRCVDSPGPGVRCEVPDWAARGAQVRDTWCLGVGLGHGRLGALGGWRVDHSGRPCPTFP